MKINGVSHDDAAVFILCLLCVCYLSPLVARTIGDLPVFALIFLFFLLEGRSLDRCNASEISTLLLILLYLAILLAYKIIGLSTGSVSYHLNITKSFIPLFCMMLIYKRLTRKQMILLVVVILATMFFTLLHNFMLKSVWKSVYSQKLYARRGVKGIIYTQYTSAIVLMTGALFCCFLKSKRPLLRCLYLAGAVFGFYFNMIVTQRTIALLLSLVMFPLLILFNVKRTKKRWLLFGLGILIVTFAVLQYDTVLNWLASIVNSRRLSVRITSIINLINAGSLREAGGGSLTARLRLIRVSIQTFFSSVPRFLFGVGLRTDSNTLVGNHSQLFDEFAKFGVFVGSLSVINVRNMLKENSIVAGVSRGSSLHNQLCVIYAIYILRAVVGDVFDVAIGMVLFMGIPLLFRILQTEKGGLK